MCRVPFPSFVRKRKAPPSTALLLHLGSLPSAPGKLTGVHRELGGGWVRGEGASS
jgi:hypothetical protein